MIECIMLDLKKKKQLTGNLLGNLDRMLHTSSFLVSTKKTQQQTNEGNTLTNQHPHIFSADADAKESPKIKRDSPRHFLCLKGIISMDFSKGAILACLLLGAVCSDQR